MQLSGFSICGQGDVQLLGGGFGVDGVFVVV